MTSIAELRTFYRCDGDHALTLFDIWEGGAANGDSVTPSTYSAPYRQWMIRYLRALLADARPPTLLSIGCGNASVEAEIARAGHEVLAVDVLEAAVEIARRKGLGTVVADVRTWVPEPGRWGVVYADGLLGHLYDPHDGLVPVFKHLHGWLAPAGGVLVVSNDGAWAGRDAQAAPGVPVHWLSADYLVSQARDAGFDDVAHTVYTYTRPLSGRRERVIVTARVPARALRS
jgi:SAM-dependent methyltransferase